MRKLFILLMVLAAIPLLGQSAFDGTWKFNTSSAEFKGNDKYLLKNGEWHCETCVPKLTVKADGQEHKVTGHPYYDAATVREVDDHTVEMSTKRGGKDAGASKMTTSEDGKTLTTEWSFISESGKEGNGKYTSERVGEAPSGANKVSGTWHPNKIESASDSASLVTFKATDDEISMSDPTGDSYTAKFDGKDYPYKGDPGTTSVSLKKTGANSFEETDKRNGKVIAVSHWTLNPDGKTMKIFIEDKLANTTMNWTADKQ